MVSFDRIKCKSPRTSKYMCKNCRQKQNVFGDPSNSWNGNENCFNVARDERLIIEFFSFQLDELEKNHIAFVDTPLYVCRTVAFVRPLVWTNLEQTITLHTAFDSIHSHCFLFFFSFDSSSSLSLSLSYAHFIALLAVTIRIRFSVWFWTPNSTH